MKITYNDDGIAANSPNNTDENFHFIKPEEKNDCTHRIRKYYELFELSGYVALVVYDFLLCLSFYSTKSDTTRTLFSHSLNQKKKKNRDSNYRVNNNFSHPLLFVALHKFHYYDEN